MANPTRECLQDLKNYSVRVFVIIPKKAFKKATIRQICLKNSKLFEFFKANSISDVYIIFT